MVVDADSPVDLEDAPCVNGCARSDEVLFSGRDLLHGLPGIFPVVRCRHCGLMRTNPRPTRSSVKYYYPPDYAPYRIEDVIATRRRAFDRLDQPFPTGRVGRMLEVGCGAGAYLRRAQAMGWDVHGVEAGDVALEIRQRFGIAIFHGQLEDVPAPVEKYDVCAMWMVLEHLHDPVWALKRLHEWTRTDGLLMLSVPNAGSFWAKLFKDCWHDLHLPNHLTHFTRQALEEMLSKTGWEVCSIRNQRSLSGVIASVGYFLRKRRIFPAMAVRLVGFPVRGGKVERAFLFPFEVLFAALGWTDRITVVARRRS